MRIDMAIEYLGLSEINGPLVAVEGVRGAFYDEIVELVVEGKQKKLGRIVEINNDYAVVQVFESTEEMSLLNTHARLTGRPLCVGLSEEILGRTFNGLGQPIDGLGAVHAEVVRDESVQQGISEKLYQNRYLCDRWTDDFDPWTETADLFRQRSAA